ncbi:MAG: radical SAM protein [Planctomycetota bacterium]
MKASYLKLGNEELAKRVAKANLILKECILCPRRCKVNRLAGSPRCPSGLPEKVGEADELGFCKSGKEVIISSSGPHHGEEPPISGFAGSGTIFFTGCNLRCLFCQNYQISQGYEGRPVTINELGQIMISLQEKGCHNINLVSPTHFVPQILDALLYAVKKGLTLPIVYNTNGYDTIETLKLLDGIVDIYLPDIKYSDDKYAEEYSAVSDYAENNRLALKEMYRQTGNLLQTKMGVAEHGVIIRHLVLPQKIAGSFASLDFIKQEISKDAYISLMSQYHPCYKAHKHSMLNRRLKQSEYDEVVRYAESLELGNCYIQSLTSSDDYLPDFNKEQPFDKQ